MDQQSYLTDLEFNPVLASSGKRFLNYLIDVIIFYVLTVAVVVGFILGGGRITRYPGTFSYEVLVRLIGILLFLIFYLLSELIFKGRTIGKFITGTKAVNEDGTEMQPQTILLRSLSRIVPFEPFSALGNPSRPWHDKWTKTYVIDVKKTALNNAPFQ